MHEPRGSIRQYGEVSGWFRHRLQGHSDNQKLQQAVVSGPEVINTWCRGRPEIVNCQWFGPGTVGETPLLMDNAAELFRM
jgi:hypothetical protein